MLASVKIAKKDKDRVPNLSFNFVGRVKMAATSETHMFGSFQLLQ